MATSLYLISNIDISKEEILRNKDVYLNKLKSLKLVRCERPKILGYDEFSGKAIREKESDWEYEFPFTYNPETDSNIPDEDAQEVIYYISPFVFNIRVYENCLELTTIYKYRYLYDIEDWNRNNLNEFRKEAYQIISIFGGTEIIYLADSCCDKLASYLECEVWEGVSYTDVKQKMIATGVPFVSDYRKLNYDELTYSNIKEFVIDDFIDF